ncbi:hypothetical protein V2I01_33370 [Micromonospora sp. BRA006-A]|nr:hypothetical protein [Micromonospora sp. BRA006-A]
MEHLLALAAGSEQESRAVLTEDDAALLLTEIAGRATLFDGPPEPVTVQIDLGTAGKQLGYLVTVGPGGSTVEPGWSADAPRGSGRISPNPCTPCTGAPVVVTPPGRSS